MNTAAIAVVAAICICIVITAIGICLTVQFSRGWPVLLRTSKYSWWPRRKARSSTRRQQRRDRHRHQDLAEAKKRENLGLLSTDDVLKKLSGTRAKDQYLYAQQYTASHPADESEGRLSNHDLDYVIEQGANAWEFAPAPENSGVLVRNGTEIEFTGGSGEQMLIANLQFPNEKRVYYFEVRLDELPRTTNVAVGVAMRGYPPRRMAGWARNSVAYHTIDGTAYYSHPLDPCHRAIGSVTTSDTIGIGWRPFSGKMFFAVNGAIVCHIRTPWAKKRMYPIVSADGPCSIHANFGARAFVLAYANMRYWGLASTEGARPPPPMYQHVSGTVLLASTPHATAARYPPAYASSVGGSTRHTSISIDDDGFGEIDANSDEDDDDFLASNATIAPPRRKTVSNRPSISGSDRAQLRRVASL
ncbi:Protein ssh4 [Coemansia sp. RSA 552]|nr:Protein ssh4 [Coemansia sp. RSA 552]